MVKLISVQIVVFFVVLLVAFCVYNAMTVKSHQPVVDPVLFPPPRRTKDQMAQSLAEAIRCKTISYDNRTNMDAAEFKKLHKLLEQTFPLAHSKLERPTGFPDLSRVFKWSGKRHDKAVLMMSHMDVVPVPPSTLDEWSVDPFAGIVRDGFIWGRGSMDQKLGVLGILEAVEWLLTHNHQPLYDVYLSFGHDEEVSGFDGAKLIAEQFAKQNIKFEFVLDEGMTITEGLVPAVGNNRVALLGISEKGSCTVEVTATSKGGHASMPPRSTAIGQLATAITKLESNQMPTRFHDGPAMKMLQHIAAEQSFVMRIMTANLWLFERLLGFAMTLQHTTNAAVRTTTAVTMVNGGVKRNVLPAEATAMINHRIVPGDTVADVLQHHKDVVGDETITQRVHDPLEASPISDPHSEAFQVIERSIKEAFPGTLTTPGLMIANTDTRWFWNLSDNIIRFCPMILRKEDLARIHGINERIGVDNYADLVKFYRQVIVNSDRL